MKISCDKQADAMYIQLSDKPFARAKQSTDLVTLNLDADDNIIGIEILYVSGQVKNPFEVLYEYVPEHQPAK